MKIGVTFNAILGDREVGGISVSRASDGCCQVCLLLSFVRATFGFVAQFRAPSFHICKAYDLDMIIGSNTQPLLNAIEVTGYESQHHMSII